MNVERGRYVDFHAVQELQYLRAARTTARLADDLASGHIPRREQSRGAVTLVGASSPLGDAWG